jgi:hypothetical protein
LSRVRYTAGACCLIMATMSCVRAAEAPPPVKIDDILYKGVVGKALDVVPMDPEQRAGLQRANAVVSNTITGRTLSIWAGLTNPVLLIGGMAWGFFAASNIKSEKWTQGRAPVESRAPVPVEQAQSPAVAAPSTASTVHEASLVATSAPAR